MGVFSCYLKRALAGLRFASGCPTKKPATVVATVTGLLLGFFPRLRLPGETNCLNQARSSLYQISYDVLDCLQPRSSP